MKVRKTSLAIFIFVLLTGLAFAQTVDEIIAKNIEAKGGYEKLKSVNSLKITANATQMGMEFKMTMIRKRPNKFRMEAEIQGMKLIRAFDGEKAWTINPFSGDSTPQEMSQEEQKVIKENSDFDGPLMDYKKKGNSVELIGKVDMEGSEVYKIKVVQKGGSIIYYFIDPECFLELKSITKFLLGDQEVEQEAYYSDYKEFGGMMIAHSIEQKGTQTPSIQTTIEKIEINPEIDDSIFVMPKKQEK